jgi:hypothetical protein
MKRKSRMQSLVRRAVLAAALSMSFSAPAFPADPAAPQIPAFSSMKPGGTMPGWEVLKSPRRVPETRYSLVEDAGVVVVKAESEQSMSALVHKVRVDVRRFPLLRWRWKIAAPVKSADMTSWDGDDYAARLYVMFDYPVEKLSFGMRMKLKLAEAMYGPGIPTAALNYIWDNRNPVGTIQANTHSDRSRMIVLRSGATQAGQWVTETRDLAADFRAAFGEEAPEVVAVVIATDTDNTGESATAWYGDIRFLPAEKAESR